MIPLMDGTKMENILNMLFMSLPSEGFLMTMATHTTIQSPLSMNMVVPKTQNSSQMMMMMMMNRQVEEFRVVIWFMFSIGIKVKNEIINFAAIAFEKSLPLRELKEDC